MNSSHWTRSWSYNHEQAGAPSTELAFHRWRYPHPRQATNTVIFKCQKKKKKPDTEMEIHRTNLQLEMHWNLIWGSDICHSSRKLEGWGAKAAKNRKHAQALKISEIWTCFERDSRFAHQKRQVHTWVRFHDKAPSPKTYNQECAYALSSKGAWLVLRMGHSL